MTVASPHHGVDSDMKITVIVPTLWIVDDFPSYIASVASLSVVGEVLIVDNAQNRAVQIQHPKIRILPQERNIYVNPAWNLGVKQAKYEIICLLNDDLKVLPQFFAQAMSLLVDQQDLKIGLIGLDWERSLGPSGYRVISQRDGAAFGCFMMMRRSDYRKIPGALKIWHGDDYLLLSTLLRGKQVIAMQGFADHLQDRSRATTEIRKAIEEILERDQKIWHRYLSRMLWLRYKPVTLLKRFIGRRIHLTL